MVIHRRDAAGRRWHRRPRRCPCEVRVGMAQMLVRTGAAENLTRATTFAAQLPECCETVVLPECLDLGWTHPEAPRLAQPIPGPAGEALSRTTAFADRSRSSSDGARWAARATRPRLGRLGSAAQNRCSRSPEGLGNLAPWAGPRRVRAQELSKNPRDHLAPSPVDVVPIAEGLRRQGKA